MSEAEQGENKSVADDGTVTYTQGRLEISLRPMTDEELNRQFALLLPGRGRLAQPLHLRQLHLVPHGGDAPALHRLPGLHLQLPVPQGLPRPRVGIYITTSNGRKYYALTRDQLWIYYHRYVGGGEGGNSPGVTGNAYSIWAERDAILRSTMLPRPAGLQRPGEGRLPDLPAPGPGRGGADRASSPGWWCVSTTREDPVEESGRGDALRTGDRPRLPGRNPGGHRRLAGSRSEIIRLRGASPRGCRAVFLTGRTIDGVEVSRGMALCAGLAACGPQAGPGPGDPPAVLATVAGKPITTLELEEYEREPARVSALEGGGSGRPRRPPPEPGGQGAGAGRGRPAGAGQAPGAGGEALGPGRRARLRGSCPGS